MSIPVFAYHQPESFEELFSLWLKYGEDARYLSGGTALMLLMRSQLLQPPALLSLAKLPGLHGITAENGVIRIGALTTHSEIHKSALVRRELPMLAETFGHIATPRVRNIATIGGNLSHANPHQDPPVSLMALEAFALVRGPQGDRRIALDDLFVDFLQTSLAAQELLIAVEVPVPSSGTKGAFIKFLPRSADDYATVNVAVTLRQSAGRVESARVVIGSMGPTPIRAIEVEKALSGAAFSAALVEDAAALSTARVDPEADFRGSPAYKKRITPAIVRRAIRQAWHPPPDHPPDR
jgi:aerobic carbon-monoxide dehydrogenase medium subunit